MSLVGKKILCIGSSGFLGGFLVKRLCEDGARVSCMDLVLRENAKRLVSFPLEKYLWKSAQDATENDLRGQDFIIFLAAQADVPLAISSPAYTFEQNTKGVMKVCEILRDILKPRPSLIYLSSESIYGKQSIIPIQETAQARPANIYGVSKLAAETIVLGYHESYPYINASILRSSTMFGPYSRPKQMVPIFLNKAFKGEPIPVDGGDQSRDMSYVENTVQGIICALQNFERATGEAFNIASGEERSVLSIAQDCIKAAQSDSKIDVRPYREGEQGLRLALDISKARKVLGYEPKVKFSEGLSVTASWVHDLVFPK